MAWRYSRSTPCVDGSRRRQPRFASTKVSQAWPGSTVDPRHAWMDLAGGNQGWRLPKAARRGLALRQIHAMRGWISPAPTKVGVYQRQPGMAWLDSRSTPCVDESSRRQPRLASTKGSQAWPGATVDPRHAWMNLAGGNQGWRLPRQPGMAWLYGRATPCVSAVISPASPHPAPTSPGACRR
jgi:hypothetical protein